jgi:cell division protein FtsQ
VQLSANVLRRRRLAAVIAAAALCALSAGIVELGYLWIKGSGMFQLRSVAVSGGTESERVAVRDAVARAAAGRSLLALSPARVAGEIEQVPTIRLASVDRDFPHTLRIRIVPERAVALAVGAGGYRGLLAASGRVVRVFDRQEAVPELPRVWTKRERPVPGSAVRSVSAQAALDALAARPRDFSALVANVKLDPERGIVMRLRGGLDIVLGPPLQLRDKLRAAAWVLRRYPTTAERAQLVYADVSAPARPAVMPRGGYAPTTGLGEQPKTRENGSQTAQNGA